MRLRRVFFHAQSPHSPDDRYAQAEVTKFLMDTYNCYFKYVWNPNTLTAGWQAIYK